QDFGQNDYVVPEDDFGGDDVVAPPTAPASPTEASAPRPSLPFRFGMATPWWLNPPPAAGFPPPQSFAPTPPIPAHDPGVGVPWGPSPWARPGGSSAPGFMPVAESGAHIANPISAAPSGPGFAEGSAWPPSPQASARGELENGPSGAGPTQTPRVPAAFE